jgi:hypothetical protein
MRTECHEVILMRAGCREVILIRAEYHEVILMRVGCHEVILMTVGCHEVILMRARCHEVILMRAVCREVISQYVSLSNSLLSRFIYNDINDRRATPFSDIKNSTFSKHVTFKQWSFFSPGATQPIVGVYFYSPLSGFSLLAYEIT